MQKMFTDKYNITDNVIKNDKHDYEEYSLYIITFALNGLNTSYKLRCIINLIKTYYEVLTVNMNVYIVKTKYKPKEIRSYLNNVLDNNDHLFISALKKPAAWKNVSDEASEWLCENLDKT